MTLILAQVGDVAACLAADRLISQMSGGVFLRPHDETANKIVVYISDRVAVSIGFAGSAYLEGVPTDTWIASQLWGGDVPLGQLEAERPNNEPFDIVLQRLAEKLGKTPGGNSVQLLVAGFRFRGNSRQPVGFKLIPPHRAGQRFDRPPKGLVRFENSIGSIQPSEGLMNAAYQRVKEFYHEPEDYAKPHSLTAEYLSEVIKSCSEMDTAIGPNASVVTIAPQARRIFCDFFPTTKHQAKYPRFSESPIGPVFYAPWIVHPTMLSPPMLFIGEIVLEETFGAGKRRWAITSQCQCHNTPPAAGTIVSIWTPQKRPPAPHSHATPRSDILVSRELTNRRSRGKMIEGDKD